MLSIEGLIASRAVSSACKAAFVEDELAIVDPVNVPLLVAPATPLSVSKLEMFVVLVAICVFSAGRIKPASDPVAAGIVASVPAEFVTVPSVAEAVYPKALLTAERSIDMTFVQLVPSYAHFSSISAVCKYTSAVSQFAGLVTSPDVGSAFCVLPDLDT